MKATSKGFLRRWIATDTNLRSSEYQKKLKSSGSFAPRTLATFRSGLNVPNMVKCFKSGHDLSPHFVRVRGYHPGRSAMLQARGRSLVRPLCVPTLTSYGFALTHWTGARRWTLTSFGFALTLPTDVRCFKFSARPFVRAHPHFAQVRAWHPNHRLMLPVRARNPHFVSGPRLTLLTVAKRFKFAPDCL